MRAIAYSKAALRALGRMPANVSRLVRSKIEQYAADPASLANNTKALQGMPGIHRLRVGDWRVLFSDDGEVVSIIRVAPRGEAYEKTEETMSPQTITTPSGERLVVLSETDYERLLGAAEDNADRAAVLAFRQSLAAGEEELLPAAIVDRFLSGENRIKVWREHRGLTSKALSERAGIGQGFLSQIETGKREGTVDTLRKIADALRVTLDDLVPSPPDKW